jgi:hypothetical protein
MVEWIKRAPHPRAVFAREWAEIKKPPLRVASISKTQFKCGVLSIHADSGENATSTRLT